MARKFNLMTGKWDEIGTGGAATSGSVITVNPEPGLPNSRQLSATDDIFLVDNGAGSTIVIRHSWSHDFMVMGG